MAVCSAISAFAPSIFAKSIFAPRRADKSANADSVPVSIMNATIAGLQIAKAGEGIVGIASEAKGSLATEIVNIDKALRKMPQTNNIFADAGKLAKFGMGNINTIIGLAALTTGLCSEDKTTALIANGTMFGGMLLAEGAHKLIAGSSSSYRENGVNKIKVKEGLYKKNPFLNKKVNSAKLFFAKQEEALRDCGTVKNILSKACKYAPLAIKGISFAAASIIGSLISYNIGLELAGVLLNVL